MLEKSTTLNKGLLEIMPDPQPVTIVSVEGNPAHVVNTWSDYVQVINDQTFLIPAAGMRSIEADVQKKSSPLTIAFGSKKFAGTEGMGRGYHVHATGEFLASGEYFDQMKANFPWLRKVLVVHVTDVEQKI